MRSLPCVQCTTAGRLSEWLNTCAPTDLLSITAHPILGTFLMLSCCVSVTDVGAQHRTVDLPVKVPRDRKPSTASEAHAMPRAAGRGGGGGARNLQSTADEWL